MFRMNFPQVKKIFFVRLLFALCLLAHCGFSFSADKYADVSAMEISKKRPLSFAVRYDYGGVFQTNDFVKGGHFDLMSQEWQYAAEREVRDFTSLGFQMNVGPDPTSWQSRLYRNPYYGFGLAFPRFDDDRLGKPFSFYATYGARIFHLTDWLKLNYEINFGYSTNWGHYDRFDNPDNVAIGWKHNAHISIFPYFKIGLPGPLSLKVGASITHFSNGATQMPNRGMNNYSFSAALAYDIHDKENEVRKDTSLQAPKESLHLEHDIILTRSFRQIYYDGAGTDLTTQYVEYRHPIYAVSYAPMLKWMYKYRCGLSLDFMYDESVGARADYIEDKADGKYYTHVVLGNRRNRFNLGVSVKNEVVMHGFSLFCNIGYDFIHGDDALTRMYEVVGVKVQPIGQLFAIVGVRAAYFSKAQYICWSLGYTFKGKPLGRSTDS